MSDHLPLIAAVELGGTKCVCLLGSGPDAIVDRRRIPTGAPDETLAAIEAVLDRWQAGSRPFAALGIASFGPADVDPRSKTWGGILATTKPGWEGTDVAGRLRRRYAVATGFDTDVNGAALAEGRWGAARGLLDFAYITVGTGIGVGLITGGRTIGGFSHAEAGHLRIGRVPGDDWPGACAFHGDCVEGLASGPAIGARAGIRGDRIPADSPIWEPVAHTLAQLLHTMLLATAPQRIMMGGGVMEHRPELLTQVRAAFVRSLNGYLDLQDLTGNVDDYVVQPGLGPMAGPLGALALAADAHATAAL